MADIIGQSGLLEVIDLGYPTLVCQLDVKRNFTGASVKKTSFSLFLQVFHAMSERLGNAYRYVLIRLTEGCGNTRSAPPSIYFFTA